MIIAINYADDKFRNAQKVNTKTAYRFGADKVIEYSPKDIDKDFREKYKHILNCKRGGGYWLWKPYIINKTLEEVDDGDYVLYSDSGSALVNPIKYLIREMKRANTDIMVFSLTHIEKKYSKRDAFIIMECDKEEITCTPQICATFILVKKSLYSCKIMKEYLEYACDERIITDQPNVMGKPDYDIFVDNRHDQTVLSLLCKREGIKPFRDPCQFGVYEGKFTKEINDRSRYPQIFESHRNPNLKSVKELEYRWYKKINNELKDIISRLLKKIRKVVRI